jgi:cadmium resistance protein CadD (predicted permease)
MSSTTSNAAPQHPTVFSIAAVTFANGGDNIGVYIPFFAINREQIAIVLLVFEAVLPILFLAGKWLGSHPLALRSLDRYGHYIVPLVFIALGTYILAAPEPREQGAPQVLTFQWGTLISRRKNFSP